MKTVSELYTTRCLIEIVQTRTRISQFRVFMPEQVWNEKFWAFEQKVEIKETKRLSKFITFVSEIWKLKQDY